MKDNPKTKSAEFLLSELWEWVGRFDQKIAIVLSIELALLGSLLSFAPNFNQWTFPLWISAICSLVTLLVSLAFIGFAGVLRSKPSKDAQKNYIHSRVYFGTISNFERKAYVEAYLATDEDEYLNDLLNQIHRNSEILSYKMKYLQRALYSLSVSLLPIIFTLILYKGIGE